MYIKRNMEKTMKEIAFKFPVVVLTGARQVGESGIVLCMTNKLQPISKNC